MIHDWLRIDERRLGVISFLVRLPNEGLSRPEVFDAVSEIAGITEVVETREDREIHARGVAVDLDQIADIRARLEDLVPGQAVRIHLLERETSVPAARAYLELARRSAAAAAADET